ncbi:MAG TPA: hypothetical protein PLS56_01355 [Candidatus Dojkabacteria bacterium]|nr:hypothetical protein [Candidatus Dojkabacteria bacterium]
MPKKVYKSYAQKKDSQKSGTYHGSSPFFNNIPQFQGLWPLRSYPHLRKLEQETKFKFPPEKKERRKEDWEDE